MSKIPHEAIEALVSAAQNAVTNKQSHYKARNGRLVTIEGDDGERMWLVSLEDMNDIERALEAADAARAQGAEVEPVVITDTDRLDFLDQCNARLNAHYKTRYGWKMVMNHNVNRLMTGQHLDIDLQDAEARGWTSCRYAIDAEIRRIKAARATLDGCEANG